jgi:hypothetical protein
MARHSFSPFPFQIQSVHFVVSTQLTIDMAKSSSTNFFWDRLVPTIYSAGAAVVIFGAWAKITHNEQFGFMLTIFSASTPYRA